MRTTQISKELCVQYLPEEHKESINEWTHEFFADQNSEQRYTIDKEKYFSIVSLEKNTAPSHDIVFNKIVKEL